MISLLARLLYVCFVPLPGFVVEGRSYSAETSFVALLPRGEFVQFETWKELRQYYRDQAQRMRMEVFDARFFVFELGRWTEVNRPASAH
jgi:hypothetical protein